ncbi:unnamed protein product [Cylicocyclus nassatus]|uniref:SHSP domain-containing protein n=1 Tax=Cylicocyclus nassatus TaxID=53992 RepID=A0AA36DN76_CYLNA|nr:unnamed protein product [Cylicocyclus nassatus]
MSLSLWQVPLMMDRLMDGYTHKVDRTLHPYWKNADHSTLHVGKEMQVIDDEKRFFVSLYVSQFRPEELRVHLDGRELSVEGKQEHKIENNLIHRSFIRKWTLPESVDLKSVHTQLTHKGHLCIEVPKKDPKRPDKRNIPIVPYPRTRA